MFDFVKLCLISYRILMAACSVPGEFVLLKMFIQNGSTTTLLGSEGPSVCAGGVQRAFRYKYEIHLFL